MVPEARPEKSLEMGGALDSRDHQHSEIGALFTRRGSSERKLNIDYKHDKQKTRKHHEGQTILVRHGSTTPSTIRAQSEVPSPRCSAAQWDFAHDLCGSSDRDAS